MNSLVAGGRGSFRKVLERRTKSKISIVQSPPCHFKSCKKREEKEKTKLAETPRFFLPK